MPSSDPIRRIAQLVRLKFNSDGDRTAWNARVKTVGVVGAGIMGASIAAAHVAAGKRVLLVDNNPAALASAPARIAQDVALAAQSNAWPKEIAETLREAAAAPVHPQRNLGELLRIDSDLRSLADADLVIESIVEKIDAKKNLFDALKSILRPDAVVTTNSPALSVARLAESWPHPESFCGFHFCHPVRERPLAEIVFHPRTSQETLAVVAADSKAIGKLPLITADKPGFLVNRLLFPLLGAAMEMAQEGIPLQSIDATAEEFGFAKGPFRLMDEIGLDTVLQAGWTMAEAFPERTPSSPLLVSLLKAKRLGCKSGRGFFAYEGDPPKKIEQDDSELNKILERWRRPDNATNAPLLDRLIRPMAAEARLAIEDGVVSDPDEIDLAVIFGLGFPPSRGSLQSP